MTVKIYEKVWELSNEKVDTLSYKEIDKEIREMAKDENIWDDKNNPLCNALMDFANDEDIKSIKRIEEIKDEESTTFQFTHEMRFAGRLLCHIVKNNAFAEQEVKFSKDIDAAIDLVISKKPIEITKTLKGLSDKKEQEFIVCEIKKQGDRHKESFVKDFQRLAEISCFENETMSSYFIYLDKDKICVINIQKK